MDRFNRLSLYLCLVLLLCFSAVLIPAPAYADSFYLVVDHCGGGCGPAPFGEITLTQGSDASTVHVDISLNDGNKFIHTGMQGSTVAFNISGNPTINLANVTLPNWSLDSTAAGSLQFDGFGNFDYSINCCNNQNGGANAQAGPVSFDIINTGGALTPASFEELSSGGSSSVFFGVDILSGTTGNSGPVGTGLCPGCGNVSAVPEPASLLLLGTGLSAVALWRRKRSKL